jgi:hypothetical protein
MPLVEARPSWSYDEVMKARIFSVVLICGAVAMSACLAAERSAAPAAATDGRAATNPADHADGHQAPGPGGSGSVRTQPAGAGEPPGADAQNKGVSKALRPDAETPPAAPTHAHGSQPTGQSSHDGSARLSNPIDTRITVNQGRTPQTHRKGHVPTREAPLGNASRANASRVNAPQGRRVPHAVHAPTRNAIGVAPGAVFPGTGGARTPAAAAHSPILPGVRPLPGASAIGRIGSSGTGATSIGSPMIRRPAAINGTGMARGPLRAGEIGGPAKNNGGISGSSVRAKRP